MGHWASVVVFIVVVLLYDDSILISKKIIQALVRAISSMTHSI